MSYINNLINKAKIPQSRPISTDQVKNDAGGYVYQVDKWSQLSRFLIIGSEGNGYYVNEATKFDRSVKCVDACLKENATRTIADVVDISVQGRAPKNDQAIFVLAKASMHKDKEARRLAFEALPKVCRIGTHLYQFVEFRKHLGGGWGRLMREGVANWFESKKPERLAYQVAKYAQRGGWSARDLLRKSHPDPYHKEHDAIYEWVTKGQTDKKELPEFLKKVDEIKTAEVSKAAKLIVEYNLPREVVPTEMLKEKKIWEALLQNMPMTAAIRNLGKMSSIGILGPLSNNAKNLAKQLKDPERVQKSRLHPLNVLQAVAVYKRGRGIKGSLSWTVNKTILSALEDTFYLSFKNVEPTGKRTLMALDVSGSMGSTWGPSGFLTAREISAAMAMVTLRTEQEDCYTLGFCHKLVDLKLTDKDSIAGVLKKISNLPFGRTDCALPMIWAAQNKVPVDTFVIYTDNETWHGPIHPSQALKAYRQSMKINAKLIVCATEASSFSIADPRDPGMLDIAGFDSAVPQIISQFSMGKL